MDGELFWVASLERIVEQFFSLCT